MPRWSRCISGRRCDAGGRRRQQPLDALYERRRGLPAGQARPLDFPETIRHSRGRLRCGVDDHWNEKGHVLRHVARALDGQPPLPAEVALLAGIGMRGDHRHEERTVMNLLANLPVPGVPATQLAAVEPYLDPGAAQTGGDPLRRIDVFRGVAEEYRSGHGGHLVQRVSRHPRSRASIAGRECPELPAPGNVAPGASGARLRMSPESHCSVGHSPPGRRTPT